MKNNDKEITMEVVYPMKPYDYVLVGSGLYSAVFAYLAVQKGKKCLVCLLYTSQVRYDAGDHG